MSLFDDYVAQFKRQEKEAERAVQRLEQMKGSEAAQPLKSRLNSARQSFEEILPTGNAEALRKKAANELNSIIGDAAKIIKHGRLLTKQDKTERGRMQDIDSVLKGMNSIERQQKKKEAQAKKDNKLVKRFMKYATAGDEVTPEPEDVEPEPTPSVEPVTSTDLQKQIQFAKSSAEENELDLELISHADKLASDPTTHEDAQAAIDAALDGFTYDEFLAGQVNENVKGRIMNIFNEFGNDSFNDKVDQAFAADTDGDGIDDLPKDEVELSLKEKIFNAFDESDTSFNDAEQETLNPHIDMGDGKAGTSDQNLNLEPEIPVTEEDNTLDKSMEQEMMKAKDEQLRAKEKSVDAQIKALKAEKNIIRRQRITMRQNSN